jgi:hypothetical protein
MRNAFCTSGTSPTRKVRPDFLVSADSAVPSIYVVTPCSKQAHLWVGENVPADALWFSGSVIVESRFVAALVAGVERDGLVVDRG